mgnify:CR=1 FL=1
MLPSASLPLLSVLLCVSSTPSLLSRQDIFSLGCVIAELWLGEGRAFFDLGTLLAYRRGEYDPAKQLAAVEPDIAELVMHMIQRAPGVFLGKHRKYNAACMPGTGTIVLCVRGIA